MFVISFFEQLFTQLPRFITFVTTPLSDLLNISGDAGWLSDWTILSMFGVGVIATLVIFLAIHLFILIKDSMPEIPITL